MVSIEVEEDFFVEVIHALSNELIVVFKGEELPPVHLIDPERTKGVFRGAESFDDSMMIQSFRDSFLEDDMHRIARSIEVF